MAGFRLIPREEKFYSDFNRMADELCAGAALLETMLAADLPVHELSREIKAIEHRCDQLTHQIITRLNLTFITPIDREDIHALAVSLDDVLDAIDAAANLFPLYRITSLRFGARELAILIRTQVDVLRLAVQGLEGRKGAAEHLEEVKRLEYEADGIYHAAVGRLFDEEKDPITVMKWKEVLDLLEAATDRCEDVGNMIEGIIVKHG